MKRLIIAMSLMLSLFLTGCGVEIVDTGHRGIEVKFGKVQNEVPLTEDIYFYNPFTTSIYELDVREQRWESKTKAYTKDVQEAEIEFVLNYRLEPMAVTKVYQTVGRNWAEVLVPQAVIGPLKNVIGKWEAEKLIENRDVAAKKAEDLIRSTLESKSVQVVRFEITDVGYTDKFEKAVEDKVVEEQNAIKQTHVTMQSIETKKQKILSAEAEAESIRIRGEALEKNNQLVDLILAEKWDGKLPVWMHSGSGAGSVPFINIKPPQ